MSWLSLMELWVVEYDGDEMLGCKAGEEEDDEEESDEGL